MRVFLAGKMDLEYGSWRDALLDRVPYDRPDGCREVLPRWRYPSGNRSASRTEEGARGLNGYH
jgi:hypothetical protein